ncbi:hypothetical protein GY524_004575 [Escherichia coli]|uniref:Uncharacterized protein n=2 Tax=Escherichia coli TaxID=562 RepID=A0A5B9ASC9_ECOLX|nr:hypothetical protein [Escherichia coli]EEY8316196.1 hypothetical protein [Escherichia coli]EEY8672105.1 hypothetical protein [Escherichia coli]EEY9469124.1 hypothetical protein [Escherichia coli]EFA4400930.1 hypothetical protein [Escherichia coli]
MVNDPCLVMQPVFCVTCQNSGGTVVIFNGWHIDNNIYKISKTELFLSLIPANFDNSGGV